MYLLCYCVYNRIPPIEHLHTYSIIYYRILVPLYVCMLYMYACIYIYMYILVVRNQLFRANIN